MKKVIGGFIGAIIVMGGVMCGSAGASAMRYSMPNLMNGKYDYPYVISKIILDRNTYGTTLVFENNNADFPDAVAEVSLYRLPSFVDPDPLKIDSLDSLPSRYNFYGDIISFLPHSAFPIPDIKHGDGEDMTFYFTVYHKSAVATDDRTAFGTRLIDYGKCVEQGGNADRIECKYGSHKNGVIEYVLDNGSDDMEEADIEGAGGLGPDESGRGETGYEEGSMEDEALGGIVSSNVGILEKKASGSLVNKAHTSGTSEDDGEVFLSDSSDIINSVIGDIDNEASEGSASERGLAMSRVNWLLVLVSSAVIVLEVFFVVLWRKKKVENGDVSKKNKGSKKHTELVGWRRLIATKASRE